MTEPASDLRLMRSFLEQWLRLAEEDRGRESPKSYERGYNAGCRAAIVIMLAELKAIEEELKAVEEDLQAIEDRREKQRHD